MRSAASAGTTLLAQQSACCIHAHGRIKTGDAMKLTEVSHHAVQARFQSLIERRYYLNS